MILWIGFGFLAFLRPLGAEGKLLFEIIAAEGMCFTEYHSALLELEPREFPELNPEQGSGVEETARLTGEEISLISVFAPGSSSTWARFGCAGPQWNWERDSDWSSKRA